MFSNVVKVTITLLIVVCLLGLSAAAYFNFYVSRLEVVDYVLNISGLMLFCFLMVLILRYLIILTLAFLQHLRHMAEPLEPEEYPTVTAILPAFNEGAVIDSALGSLMHMDYPSLEVIVVDDGSTDDTYERAERMAKQYGSRRIRVMAQANGGKSRALNMGIAHARGQLILCMDADSRLDPATLKHAVKHFADPKVGAVAGNVKVVNRINTLSKLQALEYIEGLNLVRIAQAFFGRVAVIPGPVGVFRKHVLEELGGYRSDTFAEDCELTLRIILSGWQIRYESKAIAWTEAPEHSEALFKQRYRWTRGILQALRKHRSSLWRPMPDMTTWLILWTLAFESSILPAMNLIGMLVFIITGLSGGLSYLIPLWWAQLTVLDVVIALFCLALEGESLSLALYALPYRLFFIPFVDVMRFFAWLDEMYSVRMGWMRLDRVGRI